MNSDFVPTTDLEHARKRCFAYLGECGPEVVRNDDVRRKFVSYVIGKEVASMRDWTPRQLDWTARKIALLDDESRRALVEAAVMETTPPIDPASLDGCRVDLSPAESVEQALALCDRAAEVGHELFYALGDAALVLVAAAPGARKKDVLAEHLKEREHLKPLLCPDGEDGDPVTRWLILSHVASRVPLETRLEFASVPFGYHKAAATVLMEKNGLRVPPDMRCIEARLSAVADNEHVFKKPADLKAWIAGGGVIADDGAVERVDHEAEFRALCAWLKLDAPIADALLGRFCVRKRVKR